MRDFGLYRGGLFVYHGIISPIKQSMFTKLKNPLVIGLCLSLILNILLIIGLNNKNQAREEVKECSIWAWDQTKGERLINRESESKVLYEQCMKVRYGINK